MSSSKWRVSSGFFSSGWYGAGYLWIFSQSIPLNQGCILSKGIQSSCSQVRVFRNTLIMCAPSTLSLCPIGGINPLLLDCTRSELGRDTEVVAWEPSLSSGSHSNCRIRLMPSWDTRGFGGNLRDCFQLRIFCRVTCLWKRGVGLNPKNVERGTDRAADKGGIPRGRESVARSLRMATRDPTHINTRT